MIGPSALLLVISPTYLFAVPVLVFFFFWELGELNFDVRNGFASEDALGQYRRMRTNFVLFSLKKNLGNLWRTVFSFV
jgi:hypothetical protein